MAADGKQMSLLPEDVIHKEILIRLPTKSVVRFKSVSKSWKNLFSDPEFLKNHSTRTSATQDPDECDYLLASKHSGLVTLTRYKETCMLPPHPPHKFKLIGSIHGLVCLLSQKEVWLWNPATHLPEELTLPHSDCHRSYIGLGFDPVTDDYKVIVCYVSTKRCAYVYSSNSNSWSDLRVSDNQFFKKTVKHLYPSTTIVKNCPYWTASTFFIEDESLSLVSMKFDVGSNEFKTLPEFSCCPSDDQTDFISVNIRDQLALMVYDKSCLRSMVDVYVLDEKEGCSVWNMMYIVGPLNFSKQDWDLSQGFKYGDEIVFHERGKFFCIDPRSNTTKDIQESEKKIDFPSVSCFSYSPSLVFLQGMKSVDLQTPTRISGHNSRTPPQIISSLESKSVA